MLAALFDSFVGVNIALLGMALSIVVIWSVSRVWYGKIYTYDSQYMGADIMMIYLSVALLNFTEIFKLFVGKAYDALGKTVVSTIKRPKFYISVIIVIFLSILMSEEDSYIYTVVNTAWDDAIFPFADFTILKVMNLARLMLSTVIPIWNYVTAVPAMVFNRGVLVFIRCDLADISRTFVAVSEFIVAVILAFAGLLRDPLGARINVVPIMQSIGNITSSGVNLSVCLCQSASPLYMVLSDITSSPNLHQGTDLLVNSAYQSVVQVPFNSIIKSKRVNYTGTIAEACGSALYFGKWADDILESVVNRIAEDIGHDGFIDIPPLGCLVSTPTCSALFVLDTAQRSVFGADLLISDLTSDADASYQFLNLSTSFQYLSQFGYCVGNITGRLDSRLGCFSSKLSISATYVLMYAYDTGMRAVLFTVSGSPQNLVVYLQNSWGNQTATAGYYQPLFDSLDSSVECLSELVAEASTPLSCIPNVTARVLSRLVKFAAQTVIFSTKIFTQGYLESAQYSYTVQEILSEARGFSACIGGLAISAGDSLGGCTFPNASQLGSFDCCPGGGGSNCSVGGAGSISAQDLLCCGGRSLVDISNAVIDLLNITQDDVRKILNLQPPSLPDLSAFYAHYSTFAEDVGCLVSFPIDPETVICAGFTRRERLAHAVAEGIKVFALPVKIYDKLRSDSFDNIPGGIGNVLKAFTEDTIQFIANFLVALSEWIYCFNTDLGCAMRDIVIILSELEADIADFAIIFITDMVRIWTDILSGHFDDVPGDLDTFFDDLGGVITDFFEFIGDRIWDLIKDKVGALLSSLGGDASDIWGDITGFFGRGEPQSERSDRRKRTLDPANSKCDALFLFFPGGMNSTNMTLLEKLEYIECDVKRSYAQDIAQGIRGMSELPSDVLYNGETAYMVFRNITQGFLVYLNFRSTQSLNQTTFPTLRQSMINAGVTYVNVSLSVSGYFVQFLDALFKSATPSSINATGLTILAKYFNNTAYKLADLYFAASSKWKDANLTARVYRSLVGERVTQDARYYTQYTATPAVTRRSANNYVKNSSEVRSTRKKRLDLTCDIFAEPIDYAIQQADAVVNYYTGDYLKSVGDFESEATFSVRSVRGSNGDGDGEREEQGNNRNARSTTTSDGTTQTTNETHSARVLFDVFGVDIDPYIDAIKKFLLGTQDGSLYSILKLATTCDTDTIYKCRGSQKYLRGLIYLGSSLLVVILLKALFPITMKWSKLVPVFYLLLMVWSFLYGCYGWTPACGTMVPVCVGDDMYSFFKTYVFPAEIPWPEGEKLDANGGVTFLSQRDVGFRDGFDNVVFLISWVSPSSLRTINSTSEPFSDVVQWLFASKIETFSHVNGDPSSLELFHFFMSSLNWSQVLLLMAFVVLLTPLLVGLIISFSIIYVSALYSVYNLTSSCMTEIQWSYVNSYGSNRVIPKDIVDASPERTEEAQNSEATYGKTTVYGANLSKRRTVASKSNVTQ